jgi:ribose/xylose/arabinose/galactoside ABC-type transport system permease subunit
MLPKTSTKTGFLSFLSSPSLILFLARQAIVFAFLAWMIWMSSSNSSFFTSYNIFNVLRQTAPIMIVGFGMTLILATGGIDLSVGSMVALTAVISSDLLSKGFGLTTIIFSNLGIGLIIGLINGFFVVQGIPPFIVTLALLTAVRGSAFVYSDGYATTIILQKFLELGRGRIGVVPLPVIIALFIGVFAYFLLNYTRLGTYILAVGGNQEAARLQGVSVNFVKLFTYILTGCLAALAGLIITARLGNGTPNAGQGFELDVVTAVVLGGTSLSGGKATIFGTVIGAIFVGFIRNGLNLQGVSPFWVQVITGVVLLAAIYFNSKVTTRLTEMIRLTELRKG